MNCSAAPPPAHLDEKRTTVGLPTVGTDFARENNFLQHTLFQAEIKLAASREFANYFATAFPTSRL